MPFNLAAPPPYPPPLRGRGRWRERLSRGAGEGREGCGHDGVGSACGTLTARAVGTISVRICCCLFVLAQPSVAVLVLPDPHGHCALRDALRHVEGSFGSTASLRTEDCVATATDAPPAPCSAISGSPANADNGS